MAQLALNHKHQQEHHQHHHRKKNNDEDDRKQFMLQQQDMIRTLQSELQLTKRQLLQIQSEHIQVLEENVTLKSENESLRNNIQRALEKVMIRTPTATKLIRRLQKSETFMLLSDEDFITDQETNDDEEDDNITETETEHYDHSQHTRTP